MVTSKSHDDDRLGDGMGGTIPESDVIDLTHFLVLNSSQIYGVYNATLLHLSKAGCKPQPPPDSFHDPLGEVVRY